ncbi:hypothetical protein O981_25885, partial [Mycobacterium avium 10-5560]
MAAAQRVANQFAVAAEFLDRAVTDHLARLAFGGAVAG